MSTAPVTSTNATSPAHLILDRAPGGHRFRQRRPVHPAAPHGAGWRRAFSRGASRHRARAYLSLRSFLWSDRVPDRRRASGFLAGRTKQRAAGCAGRPPVYRQPGDRNPDDSECRCHRVAIRRVFRTVFAAATGDPAHRGGVVGAVLRAREALSFSNRFFGPRPRAWLGPWL